MCKAGASMEPSEQVTREVDEEESWRQIVAVRVSDCVQLGDAVIKSILEECDEEATNSINLSQEIERLLFHHIQTFTGRRESNINPTIRRRSWSVVHNIFKKIDDENRSKNPTSLQQATATFASSSKGGLREGLTSTECESAERAHELRKSITQSSVVASRGMEDTERLFRNRHANAPVSPPSNILPHNEAPHQSNKSSRSVNKIVDGQHESNKVPQPNALSRDVEVLGRQPSNNILPHINDSFSMNTQLPSVNSSGSITNTTHATVCPHPANGLSQETQAGQPVGHTEISSREASRNLAAFLNIPDEATQQPNCVSRHSKPTMPLSNESSVAAAAALTTLKPSRDSVQSLRGSRHLSADHFSEANLPRKSVSLLGSQSGSQTGRVDQATSHSRDKWTLTSVRALSSVKCTTRDVLLVRGNRAEHWTGNAYFVRRLAQYLHNHSMSSTEVVDRAMQDVIRGGGRFLREVNPSRIGQRFDSLWIEVERALVIELTLGEFGPTNPEAPRLPSLYTGRVPSFHREIDEFDPVKKSFTYLVRYEKGAGENKHFADVWKCLPCHCVGIKSYQVASHCRKPSHVKRLAALCRNEDRQNSISVSSKRMTRLEPPKEGPFVSPSPVIGNATDMSSRALTSVGSSVQGRVGVNAVDSAATQYHRLQQVENFSDPVKESSWFLVREELGESTEKWKCLLCKCKGIQRSHLAAHCRKTNHLVLLDRCQNRAFHPADSISQLACSNDEQDPVSTSSLHTITLQSRESTQPTLTRPPSAFHGAKTEDTAIKSNSLLLLKASGSVERDAKQRFIPATILARADPGPMTIACTQKERKETNVTFVPNSIDVAIAKQVGLRLKEWDPFWRNIAIVGIGVTSSVGGTSPATDLIKSAAHHRVVLPLHEKLPVSQWGSKRAPVPWKNGDTALILRMLPAKVRSYRTKRADCHLWPKGTFLQVNGTPIKIEQRNQQSHDLSEWKGLCKEVDLTELIVDPQQENMIQICCCDDQQYVYTVSQCQYRSVDELYKTLVNQANQEYITTLSYSASFEKALNFASRQMTVALDRDNEDMDEIESRKFIFTLTCPISKTRITTPVRGKSCKHFQVCET